MLEHVRVKEKDEDRLSLVIPELLEIYRSCIQTLKRMLWKQVCVHVRVCVYIYIFFFPREISLTLVFISHTEGKEPWALSFYKASLEFSSIQWWWPVLTLQHLALKTSIFKTGIFQCYILFIFLPLVFFAVSFFCHCAGGGEMREGGGGSSLPLLTVHFPPFPWLRMNFVLFTELSETRGGRKEEEGRTKWEWEETFALWCHCKSNMQPFTLLTVTVI